MKRVEALKAIYPELQECVVVTIMGAVAVELYNLGHRPGFFYLEHAMGLASSMGLGIALARPELPVVVLDGDGSVLMNLGGLSTLGRYRPPNLVHVVFDNEVLLSVGKSFTTATADSCDLAAVATAAGVPRTATCRTVEELAPAFREALSGSEPTTLVAKVSAEGPASYFMDLHLLENRFQFQRHLAELPRAGGSP
jgi:sulfopyruvate decarboxylase subunit beta